MKLVTWNCQMAFAGEKAARLFAYEPDLAIVQECSDVAAALAAEAHGYTHLWFGNRAFNTTHAQDKPTARRRAGRLTTGTRESKGIAIFAREPWTLDLLAEPDHRWLVPLRILGPQPFTLIAVWSWVERASPQAYVDRVRLALASHAEWFDEAPVVLAGDLNSSGSWNTQTSDGHAGLVRHLSRKGLTSAYHHRAREAHGEESAPTFHLYRHAHRAFHIDYMFLPAAWLACVRYFEIGGPEWRRLSDHMPLYAEIDLEK